MRPTAWIAAAGWLACAGQPAFAVGYDPKKMDLYVNLVLTEAAGEGLRGQTAVAEVLRNRNWNTRGFSGLRRKNLGSFLKAEARQRSNARRAIRAALKGSNLSGGATHYENVVKFGRPRWASKMTITTRVGRHTFFSSSSQRTPRKST